VGAARSISPSAKRFPYRYDLAKVISIVVGDEEYLPQIGSSLAVRDFRRQIHASVSDQINNLAQIRFEPFEGCLPDLVGQFLSRPKSVRKVWRLPLRIQRVS